MTDNKLTDSEITEKNAKQKTRSIPGLSKAVFSDPAMLLAFGLGSGLSRIMPGTMGTLAALPFYLLLAKLDLVFYTLVVIGAFVFGVWLCAYASKKLGVHDHSGIVWDEFVGYWLTMLAIPLNWKTVLVGFVLFRFFDMLKPWPISLADKYLHGGFGIMFDDILAGVAAWACLYTLVSYGVLV